MKDEQIDALIDSLERGTVAMEGYVAATKALCEAQKVLADIKTKQVEKMYQLLVEGNGKDPLVYIVDRHERTLQTQSRILWIVLTIFIGEVVYGFWNYFVAGG